MKTKIDTFYSAKKKNFEIRKRWITLQINVPKFLIHSYNKISIVFFFFIIIFLVSSFSFCSTTNNDPSPNDLAYIFFFFFDSPNGFQPEREATHFSIKVNSLGKLIPLRLLWVLLIHIHILKPTPPAVLNIGGKKKIPRWYWYKCGRIELNLLNNK